MSACSKQVTLEIPKFEGKIVEYPSAHITNFHLWCSSNSLNDDTIQLSLFLITLIGVAAKWYIEFPSIKFDSFGDLANVFLNHFRLPIQYDAETELLSTFRKDKATHILDHIEEWRRRKRLIKATIPLKFLLEWLLKSLLPYISKDVSTSGITNEEEAILKSQ